MKYSIFGSLFLIGWVSVISVLFRLPLEWQMYLAAFVWAPLFEELIFRKVAFALGTRFSILTQMKWLSAFLFSFLHINNYLAFGLYYGCLVQGVLALTCWYVYSKKGYWAAVACHSLYNGILTFAHL